MKITDIKIYPTWVGHRNQCIVKVETDEGLHGWGEAARAIASCSSARAMPRNRRTSSTR